VTGGLDVLEETRAFNAELQRVIDGMPPAHTVAPEVTRQARREGRSFFPAPVYVEQARWETVPGRRSEIRLRTVEPDGEAEGLYVHIHGGGWTFGAADLQDAALLALVQKTGFAAASVEYRLAPEHPWPAAADDCEDAVLALLGRGAKRIAIGGESAGAQLSVVTLLRLRDRHGLDVRAVFSGANLVFGAFDLSGSPSRLLWGDRELVLSSPTMEWYAQNLMPGSGVAEQRNPEISPLYADLRDLPRALFTVGTCDPLLDDTLFMAARWELAGNECDLVVYPETPHGGIGMPTVGGHWFPRLIEFLRGCIEG
jgi:acetyl esterase/lipase